MNIAQRGLNIVIRVIWRLKPLLEFNCYIDDAFVQEALALPVSKRLCIAFHLFLFHIFHSIDVLYRTDSYGFRYYIPVLRFSIWPAALIYIAILPQSSKLKTINTCHFFRIVCYVMNVLPIVHWYLSRLLQSNLLGIF